MATVRLWDLRTASQIALLREGTEKIVACGFGPDGKTIYTNDSDSIVRFWSSADGRLLSTSQIRERRFIYPTKLPFSEIAEIADIANPVRMAISTAVLESHKLTGWEQLPAKESWSYTEEAGVAADVIYVATGRIAARLERPGHMMEKLQVSPDGRWIIAVEDETQLVIFSAADGSEVSRLIHPPGTKVEAVLVSRNTRRIITRFSPSQPPDGAPRKAIDWLWEPDPWRRVHDQCLELLAGDAFYLFLTDDVIWIHPDPKQNSEPTLYRIGGSSSPAPATDGPITAELGGELLRYDDTKLLDGKTFKRLIPPAGRKLHPALKRLAGDGRFYFGDMITDTATEKQIPCAWYGRFPSRFFSGFGTVMFLGPQMRILPAPDYLEIPPDLLELWAQVAVGGHLGDDGSFVKWDEPTWEEKRQALASRPAPHPGFPFPGHVAVDRFH